MATIKSQLPSISADQRQLFAVLSVLKHVADPKAVLHVMRYLAIVGHGNYLAATAYAPTSSLTGKLLGAGSGTVLLQPKVALALLEPEGKKKKGEKTSGTTATISVDPVERADAEERFAALMAEYQKKHDEYQIEQDDYDRRKLAHERAQEGMKWAAAFYEQPPFAPGPPNPEPPKLSVVTPELSGSCIGEPPELLPPTPAIDWAESMIFDCNDLLDVLAWVDKAASTDESRPFLNQVAFMTEPWPGLFASDGHRLHAGPLEGVAVDGAGIPEGAVTHLLRLLKLCKDDLVRITLGTEQDTTPARTWVRVAVGQWNLDAVRPTRPVPHRHVIPDVAAATLRAKTDAGLLAGRVGRLMKIGGGGAAVRFEIKPDGMCLSATDPDSGTAEVDLPVEIVKKTEAGLLSTGFNPRYVVDAATGMGETVILSFTEAEDACRVDGENGRLAVVMPMRI